MKQMHFVIQLGKEGFYSIFSNYVLIYFTFLNYILIGAINILI